MSEIYCKECRKFVNSFVDVDTGHSRCSACRSDNLLTVEQIIDNFDRRVTNLEKGRIIGIDLNHENDNLETHDRNEYDNVSASGTTYITVSPSNYEKLKKVTKGEMIRVFCTDNRTEGLVFSLVGITHDTVTYEPPKNETKQKPKKSKKRRAKKSKRKNASTVQKKPTQREEMIRSGAIVPENDHPKKRYPSRATSVSYNRDKYHSRKDYVRSYE